MKQHFTERPPGRGPAFARLPAFVAVAELRSFTAVAGALGMSTPVAGRPGRPRAARVRGPAPGAG